MDFHARFQNENNEDGNVGWNRDICGDVDGAAAEISVWHSVLAVRGRRRQKVSGQLQHGRLASGQSLLLIRTYLFPLATCIM